jgi:hypothetical protein
MLPQNTYRSRGLEAGKDQIENEECRLLAAFPGEQYTIEGARLGDHSLRIDPLDKAPQRFAKEGVVVGKDYAHRD